MNPADPRPASTDLAAPQCDADHLRRRPRLVRPAGAALPRRREPRQHRQAGVFIGIAAIGMTFVLLTAGIDLSVGSIMYLAPLIAGFADARPGIGVAGGLARRRPRRRRCLGAINAAAIVGLRIIPFIVDAGDALRLPRLRRLPHRLDPVRLRGRTCAPSARPSLLGPSRCRSSSSPSSRWSPMIVLTRTAFGRQVYAVGNDPEAARKAGLPRRRDPGPASTSSPAPAPASPASSLIAQIGRLDAGFGEGREFDVIAAAVLGGASLFGGIGTAFGAVVGATLIQTVKSGLVFTGVNLYLQPILHGRHHLPRRPRRQPARPPPQPAEAPHHPTHRSLNKTNRRNRRDQIRPAPDHRRGRRRGPCRPCTGPPRRTSR